jgi:O-antigen ligase
MRNKSGGLDFARRAAIVGAAAAGLYIFFRFSILELPGIRILLISVGLIVSAAAWFRPLVGLTVYLGLLVLANNWPYYFGLQHNMPYVHIAVILFGFFALGWGLRRKDRSEPEKAGSAFGEIFRPIWLAAALIAVSGALTFWRWMNFYPLRGRGLYEWMTNSNGLPASLARTSVWLSVLSYLLPFALFGIAVRIVKDRAGIERVLRAVGVVILGAVLFGFVQRFIAPGFGNTDFWVFLKQINATFKDPNAFGGVLAILLPLFFGAAMPSVGTRAAPSANAGIRSFGWRGVWVAVFILGVLVFPLIGARSAFLAFGVGMITIILIGFRHRKKSAGTEGAEQNRRGAGWRKRIPLIAAAVLIVSATGILTVRSRLYERISANIRDIVATGDVLRLSPERYFLWKHALAMTRDFPWTGVGVGAYLVELPDYYAADKSPVPPGFEGRKRLDTTENYFLHAAAELGLIGLLALLAVFAVLAREVGRGIKAGILGGRDRWLFLGAVGGLVAFGINALFHTFAHSFETPFFFWLTAAIVVILRASGEAIVHENDGVPNRKKMTTGEEGATSLRPEPPGIKPRKSRLAGILAVLLVLCFGVVHFRNSSRRLSIAEKTGSLGIDQEFGLYKLEKDETGREFRWTRAKAAWALDIRGRTIQIPLMISHPDVWGRPVHVRVSLIPKTLRGEIFLGEADWTASGWKTLEFPIPPELSGQAVILLEVDRTWSPREAGGSNDSRRLGAAVGPVSWK